MDKTMELVDSWMRSQKEFMDAWGSSQKEAVARWTEATRRLQESLSSFGGAPEGPMKEVMNLYHSWLTTMVNSAQSFADESGRVQETWKGTVEKQMEMTREMVQNLTNLFKQAGEKR